MNRFVFVFVMCNKMRAEKKVSGYVSGERWINKKKKVEREQYSKKRSLMKRRKKKSKGENPPKIKKKKNETNKSFDEITMR